MSKVRCWMVISPNGYITKPDGNEDWQDEVNWDDFVAGAEKENNFIVGRTTYDIVPDLDEIKAKYKVVVTSKKDLKLRPGYKIVNSPQEAVDYLVSQGIESILLIGGGELNGSFASAGLIDELELFVEPYIIGDGKRILAVGEYEMQLELLEVGKLSKGRARLLYKVKK